MLLFLKFRALQALRAIREVGLLLLGFAVLLTAGIWVRGLSFFIELEAFYVAAFSLFIGLSIHFSRKDGSFLEKRSIPPVNSLLVDYALVAIVLALPYCFAERWNVALAAFCVLWCASLPLPKRYASAHSRSFAPTLFLVHFEWQSFIRRQGMVLLLLCCIQIATFFHIGFFVLFILVLVGVLPELFSANECRALAPSNWQALIQKNIKLCLILLFFCSPALLLALYVHTAWWYLLLYGFFAIITVFQLFFWQKYAQWSPFHPRNNNTTTGMMAFFCVLLPGFILIGIALAFRYFLTAKKRFI